MKPLGSFQLKGPPRYFRNPARTSEDFRSPWAKLAQGGCIETRTSLADCRGAGFWAVESWLSDYTPFVPCIPLLCFLEPPAQRFCRNLVSGTSNKELRPVYDKK